MELKLDKCPVCGGRLHPVEYGYIEDLDLKDVGMQWCDRCEDYYFPEYDWSRICKALEENAKRRRKNAGTPDK